MYYYPNHYEPRYEYPSDHLTYKYEPRPRVVTTRYYAGNPYISSYNDGRFELLRRTPFRCSSVDRETSPIRSSHLARASSIPPQETYSAERDAFRRGFRAASIPPRASSPDREQFRRSIRASSVPPVETRVFDLTPFAPSITHFTPKLATGTTPTSTFSYFSRLPTDTNDKKMDQQPRRMYSANPVSFGPRTYTSLSVFPSMKYTSYSLMEPIDRYRYRTTPTKSYSSYPSTSYYSYPTPTRSTSSAYRQSDLYPTRFQINRVTSPAMEQFYAGRRTLY